MKWEPKPIGDGLCEVPLTQAKVAILDEGDVEKLLHCQWHASTSRYSTTFYAKGRATGTRVAVHMHRVILCFPLLHIDHINGNGLDNRRSNLRLCTAQQNMCNIRPRAAKTSRYRGVYASGRQWVASIRVSFCLVNLGSYETEELAAAAYDYASLTLHGQFGVRNGFKPGPITQRKVIQKIASKLGIVPGTPLNMDGELVPDPLPAVPHSKRRGFKYMDGRLHSVEGRISTNERVGLHQLAKALGGRVTAKFVDGSTRIKFTAFLGSTEPQPFQPTAGA